MTEFLSRAEVREVDRHAIEDLGIPGVVLMENAGRAVAEAVKAFVGAAPCGRPNEGEPKAGRPHGGAPKVAIVCGRGNNGGDGYVVARHLILAGIRPSVHLLCNPGQVTGDAEINVNIIQKMGVVPILAKGPADLLGVPDADVVVDALLGTGLAGEVREPYRSVIAYMNELARPTIAVDIPSGLDCDTGEPLGIAVRATRTLTFVALKKGFRNPASRQFTGDITVADIGAPH